VLALAGPPYSGWLLALAASIHVSALLSLLGPALVNWTTGRRVLLSLLLFLGLRVGVYEPIAGWAGRVYSMLPLTGFTPGTYVQDGDVLLYEGRWQRPATFQRGEIVAYRVRARQRGGVMAAEGVGLDRVVGLPGDHIRVNAGTLRVNGGRAPGPRSPLGPMTRMPDLDFTVPQGCYAILPSRLQMAVHGNPQVNLMFGELSCVAAEDVWGRVVMRVRPWSRFGRLE
jgi:signal peptidase I